MRNGLLQQCDTPQMLYDNPANTFVAGFIGSPAMNLFEGALISDGSAITVGSQRLELPAASLQARSALNDFRDRPVVVGIRPEDLTVANGHDPGARLLGEVELVEALGSEQLVHFRTDAPMVRTERAGAADDLAPAEVSDDLNVARIAPRPPVTVGERIAFAIQPDRVEFFDPATGTAIRG
jgi:multiple sugar transport system ATP-binding protein